MKKLSVISLYTGAGGLDLGLESAGFEPLACVEMDKEAVATLRHNRPKWPVIHARLKPRGPQNFADITPEEVVEHAGEGPDLLVGGPPCQPFSKSGYWHSGDSARLDDPRADTLESYIRTLELAKPRAFMLENVPGLAFNSKSEGLSYLRDRIRSINRRCGTSYSFHAARVNAAEYGVPQLRERVFVIGHREGLEFEFPAPTHLKPPRVDMTDPRPHEAIRKPQDGLEPYLTAWDAIGHLDDRALEADDELRMRGKYADVLPTIPEGCNYLFHADKEGKKRKLFGWRTRYWSMLLKLEKSRPSWTLTAQPGPAIGPFHWKSRRLSAAELCALQTFPADYEIVGSNRSAHKQLGNAVPSALVELLGLEIRRQFFGHRVRRRPRLLPERRDPLPKPERPSKELPASLKKEQKVYAPHGGPGQGPSAQRRLLSRN
jgi:DNA (cytosine-5)-methyltransferase 1